MPMQPQRDERDAQKIYDLLKKLAAELDVARPNVIRLLYKTVRENASDLSLPSGTRATWIRIRAMIGHLLRSSTR